VQETFHPCVLRCEEGTAADAQGVQQAQRAPWSACLVRHRPHARAQQARQKLATLPEGRYRDLASDVWFELERRYPEFRDDLPQPEPAAPPPRSMPPPSMPPVNGAQQSSAANEVLVPNKSNIVEEDVGMPPQHQQRSAASNAASPPPSESGGRHNDGRSVGRMSEGSSFGGTLLNGYRDRGSVRRHRLTPD
jgi:hypothetical protein